MKVRRVSTFLSVTADCRVGSFSEGVAMATVHVFISTGRFRSLEEMRTFIDETYTEDGDGVLSAFMREVGLSGYEPNCIEAIHHGGPVALPELLAQASYADQWILRLNASGRADAAICVFEPNSLEHPRGSSLEYIGAFEYQAASPERAKHLVRGE
jgi:hypothetical protein